MKNLSIFPILLLLLFFQSCEIPIDKGQAQDSYRGEIIVSDNLTSKIKLGDTITVSYKQSEIFTINSKEKLVVYEEDIEKFYLSLSINEPDDKLDLKQREIPFGGDIFTIIQDKGEYGYSRLYPKFDIKTREYVGKFKIVFKQKGVFFLGLWKGGLLKLKNTNAFVSMKFSKSSNTDSINEFVKNMSEKEKTTWINIHKLMVQDDVRTHLFFRVE